MMNKIKFLLFLLAVNILIILPAKAEIFIEETDKYFYISLENEITKSDISELTNKTSNNLEKKIYIKLSSQGGNLISAMNIGRLLRKNNATATVREGEHCMSSCVFILAGAPYRNIYGDVGIHRPYLSDDKASSTSKQKNQHDKIKSIVTGYLKEMNITDELYEAMYRIPPDEILILSKNDIKRYGLSSVDPLQHDADIAVKSDKLGITSAELIKRKSVMNQACNKDLIKKDISEFVKCENEIIEKGNLEYRPKDIKMSQKDLIDTMDLIRPNWREITQSNDFQSWLNNLPSDQKESINSTWDPYFLNGKIQEYIDQKSNKDISVKSVKLSCKINQSDVLLDVNFNNSTVNDKSAKIDKNYIITSGKGANFIINRVTGHVKVEYNPPYSKKGVPLTPDYGSCIKVDSNKF